jgi:hypothetical protein
VADVVDICGIKLTRADALLAENILTEAFRYCPDLQRLAPKDPVVHAGKLAFYEDYQLARISWASGEKTSAVLGFYAPGDFRPVDESGRAIEELNRLAPLLSDGGPVVSYEQLHEYAENNPGVITLDRTETAPAFRRWELLDGDAHEHWAKRLRDEFGLEGPLTLRFAEEAELSFYRRFRLMEVLRGGPDDPGRSYFLVGHDGANLRRLDGQSALLHEINDIEGALMLDSPQRVDDYLRFFCWATHADEGSFLLPRYFREMPLAEPPDAEERVKLRERDWRITSVTVEEATKLGFEADPGEPTPGFRRATVAYGEGLFEAVFSIEMSGAVQMVDDEPLATVALCREAFHQGELFLLRPIGAEEFVEELARTGSGERRIVERPVTSSASARRLRRRLSAVISRCTFRDEVQLSCLGRETDWLFKGCRFEAGVVGGESLVLGRLQFVDCVFAPKAQVRSSE